MSIDFMEDFTERSWFACLQNSTPARIDSTRSFDHWKRKLPLIPIFKSEFCLAMKLTFVWMDTSINKTVFGVTMILKCMLKLRYIQKNGLFGVLYGLEESLVRISLKTMLVITPQSMVTAIEPWILTFSLINWSTMMRSSCGFNSMAQHVTQLVPQLIYWSKRLVNLLPRL